jgi:hypothetical protein
MYKLAIGSFLLIGALTTNLKAQEDTLMIVDPIETDRPDQSESAGLIPKGYFQMENGFSIEDIEPGFIYTYPSTLWAVGVNENFEVRVITTYINIQHEPNPDIDGLLPVQVGFKAKLLSQHGVIPKAAVLGHLSLPGIASKQFETTYFAPSMRLAFQNDVTDILSVSYNLGVEWDGEDPRPTFLYTFSPAVSLFHGLSAFIEVYGDVPQQRSDDFRHRLDGGFTYLVSNDVLVDISGGIGLSDNAPEKFIAVGLSYRFKM